VPIQRSRAKVEGLQPVAWHVSASPPALLQTGPNLLALEGLNDRASGSDF
jgi:hypothetical protein